MLRLLLASVSTRSGLGIQAAVSMVAVGRGDPSLRLALVLLPSGDTATDRRCIAAIGAGRAPPPKKKTIASNSEPLDLPAANNKG